MPQISDSVRKVEMELAACICCHKSILAIDHIGEIIRENGNGSNIGKINLHRTKCSRLIDSAIASCLKDNLKHNLQRKKYSLLLDESTDSSTTKHLCICIRYFNEEKLNVDSALLSLISVVSTTGEALIDALKNCLDEF